MDTSGGFFFSFDPPAEASGGAQDKREVPAGGAASPPAWPAPSVSTTLFPWVPLTRNLAAQWAAAYCQPSASVSAATRPRQLQLTVSPSALTVPSSSPSERVSIALCYQTAPEVSTLTSVAAATSANAEHRDVIPGRYYGGLKVWSCATLLAEYIGQHAEHYGPLFRSAQVVVELGCGQGLPGLAAVCLGARRVAFQDYNAEVLDVCMKPNLGATLAANSSALFVHAGSTGDSPVEVKFVHGDWVDLQWERSTAETSGEDDFCDVVLGADVTFDKEACDKLATVLQRWLRPGSGEAVIASKDYYFGTNGGYLEFTRSAEACGLQVALLERMDTADKMPHVIFRVTHASR